MQKSRITVVHHASGRNINTKLYCKRTRNNLSIKSQFSNGYLLTFLTPYSQQLHTNNINKNGGLIKNNHEFGFPFIIEFKSTLPGNPIKPSTVPIVLHIELVKTVILRNSEHPF